MIKLISKEEIWKIQKVAHNTWPPTFKGILSDEQLYYMLDLMYSSNELKIKIDDSHLFYGYEEEGLIKGFVSYKDYGTYYKIHKLYVMPIYQGQSIGKKLIDFVVAAAFKSNVKTLLLNVNRYNKAVEFYKYLGFTVVLTEDIEIGNGYLMEDYRLKLDL